MFSQPKKLFQDLLVKKELPKVVCYECSMHIIKYYKLIEKSLISQATLLDILNENGNVRTQTNFDNIFDLATKFK